MSPKELDEAVEIAARDLEEELDKEFLEAMDAKLKIKVPGNQGKTEAISFEQLTKVFDYMAATKKKENRTLVLKPINQQKVEQRISVPHPKRKRIVYCIKSALGLDTHI